MPNTGTKKTIAFGEPTVYSYQSLPGRETDDCSSPRISINDLVSRERLIQRVVARRAVMSIQQQLRENKEDSNSHSYHDQLAAFAAKFSKRARDIALESARVNYLDAYPTPSPAHYPKFFSNSHCFNIHAPIELSEFPSFKMTVSLEDSHATKSSKQKRKVQNLNSSMTCTVNT